ncbi:MAG: PLP-dependent aminotransferase family protein, partial [Chloroflexota bacterium]
MTMLYDLKLGYPDIKVAPRQRFGEITVEVLSSGRGWQYGGDLQGILPYREQIARFLTDAAGVPVTTAELMGTSGALSAVDIVCRTLTRPGDVVVVEDPTFFFVVHVLRMCHVEVVGVPLCEQGIDLDALEGLVERYGERLKLVYTIPSFHNPTGVTATNRNALAQMAQRHNFTLLEDATYQQLYYGEPPPPYLKLSDQSGHVVTVGSMSKLLMPALRIGWIWALPEQIERFKMFKDDAGSALTSEIVADFMRSGEFMGQVEFARNLYARKHEIAVAALDRYAPAWLGWSAPGGGFFIWGTLPEGLTAERLKPFATERGVSFMSGRDSYVNPPDDQHIRVCFAMLDEGAL